MQLDQSWLKQQGEDAVLLHSVDTAFGDYLPARIGIAVSGGGDSIALLHLFARWSVQTGRPIAAVTVDHNLRTESTAEARGVAHLCKTLGIPHDILNWAPPEGAGNLPAAARNGRYALMADWGTANGIDSIALGHTVDDNAENFLMRLGRSAGIDGLAEMESKFERHGIRWSRPLWQLQRAELRDYLIRQGVPWVDDPSNDNPRYARTKVRRLLPALTDVGITAKGIHHSAFALRQAQSALMHYTRQEAAKHVIQDVGDLVLPQQIDPPIPVDIERRLVALALQWIGSNPYPPRKMFADALNAKLMQRQRLTMAGCLVMKRKGQFRITREYNAVKDTCGPTEAIWDSRWRLDGPHVPNLEVRALGDAVNQLPDWRKTGVPRPTLMASPAIWRGNTLIAAPLGGYNPDWSAQIVADFTSFLLSH